MKRRRAPQRTSAYCRKVTTLKGHARSSTLFQSKPQDRIDRLYYKSNRTKPQLKPIGVTLYPKTLEDENIPYEERQFSSDHAALLFEFEWVD